MYSKVNLRMTWTLTRNIKFAIEGYFSEVFEDDAQCPAVVNCEEKTRGGIQVSPCIDHIWKM